MQNYYFCHTEGVAFNTIKCRYLFTFWFVVCKKCEGVLQLMK